MHTSSSEKPQHKGHRQAHALGAGVEVDLQQVQQITGNGTQQQRQQDLHEGLHRHAEQVHVALLQGVGHPVGGREQHQAHGVINGYHHQQQVGQGALGLILLYHHEGGCRGRGRSNGTQGNGRCQRQHLGEQQVHPHQGHVHQGSGDHRLGNAYGNGLLTHAPQGAESEFIADDKGDKAQRHLRDHAVALHLLQGAKADAQAAEAQPPQHKGAQQQPGHQIGCDRRKVHRLRQTGHQQARDQCDGQADKHLFHTCSPGAERLCTLPHFLLIL